jgi:hypothetical protein
VRFAQVVLEAFKQVRDERVPARNGSFSDSRPVAGQSQG